MPTAEEQLEEFDTLARQVDEALAAVGRLEQPAREVALELKESLEALQRFALMRLVKRMRDDPAAKEVLLQSVSDPAIYTLFLIHGIVKSDVRARVLQALEQVRPYIHSHGGEVELAGVANGTVVLRLKGACAGCGMASQTLRNGVEKAIRAHVPEVRTIEVEDDEAPAGDFIPLAAIDVPPVAWMQVLEIAEMAEAVPYHIQRDQLDALVFRLDGQVKAYRNRCAHREMPLDKGLVEDGELTCPWHGYRYDLASGLCRTEPGARLMPLPVRMEGGSVWLRRPS
ncbi:MAG: NifU family protein [Thermaerobacter sp.]|nr:NifU family protein [Thermaerobacter sp.]